MREVGEQPTTDSTGKVVVSTDNVIPCKGGAYSLYCTNCGRWIPNTANHEMRKEGCFAHSHICFKYADDTVRIVSEEGKE